MKQLQPRIVGDEIKRQFLEPAQHHDVFGHTCGRLAANMCHFETMAVQV